VGSSLDKNESGKPNKEFAEASNDADDYAEQQPADIRQANREIIQALADRRTRFLEQDALGRTPLFYAAEKGFEEEVKEIIFSFSGTGLAPPRLKLITAKDHSGLTAADVAEKNGHKEIAGLLRKEQIRMEYYE